MSFPPLCDFTVNTLNIRGMPIEKLIDGSSFLGTLVFMLEGQDIDDGTAAVLNAMLVAWVDHGANPPSTANVRNVASVRGSFAMGAMAALATFGADHVPIEECGKFLREMTIRRHSEHDQYVFVCLHRRVPGFGHPVHTEDPRVRPLLKVAARHMNTFIHVEALRNAEKCLARKLNESDSVMPVKPNLAGVTAALWLDLGFDLDTVGLVPLIGRSVGWAAHYSEQRSLPAFSGSIP